MQQKRTNNYLLKKKRQLQVCFQNKIH